MSIELSNKELAALIDFWVGERDAYARCGMMDKVLSAQDRINALMFKRDGY
jgi:hypothetical protein